MFVLKICKVRAYHLIRAISNLMIDLSIFLYFGGSTTISKLSLIFRFSQKPQNFPIQLSSFYLANLPNRAKYDHDFTNFRYGFRFNYAFVQALTSNRRFQSCANSSPREVTSTFSRSCRALAIENLRGHSFHFKFNVGQFV